MKIKFGIITLLMLPISFSCANKPRALDLFKRMDLYDETGETLINYMTFKYKHNLVVEDTFYNASGEVIQQGEFSYDKHNNLVYFANRSKDVVSFVQFAFDYKYDNKGRILCKIDRIKNDEEEWEYDRKTEYTYEEFKTSAIDYTYNHGGWERKSDDEWQYDDKNRLIKHIFKTEQGFTNYEETHEYDEYDCDIKITTEYTTDPDQKTTIKECEYYKHLSNRPSKITTMNYQGSIDLNVIEEYEYDKHLNVTLYKMYIVSTPTTYMKFVRFSY